MVQRTEEANVYDWLDNDGIASAESIIPEYQNLAVGDAIPLYSSLEE